MIKCERGRTNPQKMQRNSDKHSVIWGMLMSSTLQASVFMGKNYTDNLHSIKNTEDPTMKQIFDIFENLITEQSDESYGVNTINWEDSSWKYLSLVGDEEVISLLHTKVYVFSDSVLCLGKVNENPKSNIAWEERLKWFKSSPDYRALDRIDCEPMEFEWNIFPGFTTLQICSKVQELLTRLSVEPEKSQDGFSSCRCSTTSRGDLKTIKRMRVKCSARFSLCEKSCSRTMVIPRTWIRKEVVLC